MGDAFSYLMIFCFRLDFLVKTGKVGVQFIIYFMKNVYKLILLFPKTILFQSMLLVCATCHLYLKMHERTVWITSHIHRKLRFYSPHQKNINTANPHVPLSTDGVKKHSVLTMALFRYQFHLSDAWRRSRVIFFSFDKFFFALKYIAHMQKL